MTTWRALLCLIGLALAVPGAGAGADFASADLDFLGRGRASCLAASPGHIDNLFWNASGLLWRRTEAGVSFAGWMDYLAGLRGGAAGYAGATRGGRSLGGFITYLTSGSVALTTWDDPTGGRGETFAWTEISGGLAGGIRVLPRVSVGAGLKVVRQTMDDEAATVLLADISGTASLRRWTGEGNAGIQACVVARNLVVATWGTGGDPGSGSVEMGLAADLAGGSARTACSMFLGRDGRREACLGLAALLSDQFEVRLGYRRRIGTSSDASFDFGWQRGLAAGFGVDLGRFWLDYTYEDATPLDGIHRLALRGGGD